MKKSLSKLKNKDKMKNSAPSATLLVKDLKKLSKSKPEEKKKEGYLIPKSNNFLRGATSCLLIKGLPLNVKIHKLKKDLGNAPKSIKLSKKDGQRSAFVTFKSDADCAESFDALMGYSYEGRDVRHQFFPHSIYIF